MSAERVPVDPGSVITIAGLEAERLHRGNIWCEAHIVGPRRQILERVLPPNVVALHGREIAGYARAKEAAKELLATHCHECGGCPWSKR